MTGKQRRTTAKILKQIKFLLDAYGDEDTVVTVRDFLAFRLELLSARLTVH